MITATVLAEAYQNQQILRTTDRSNADWAELIELATWFELDVKRLMFARRLVLSGAISG